MPALRESPHRCDAQRWAGVATWVSWFLLGFFSGFSVAAQEYPGRLYDLEDGLPSAKIRDIGQDSRGALWVATRSGVATWEGLDWRVYNVRDGLTWADQFALRWDRSGRLWGVSNRAPFRLFQHQEDAWVELPFSHQTVQFSGTPRITAFELLEREGRSHPGGGNGHRGAVDRPGGSLAAIGHGGRDRRRTDHGSGATPR